MTDSSWESELATFLNDLLTVQDELLALLGRKRELLMEADTAGLAELAPQEEQLVARLQESLRCREELLGRARGEGLPSASLQSLARALPGPSRRDVGQRIDLARSRARLLSHQSLTNWVLVQRSLIHLSQLIEIIATGGRLQPTYGDKGGTHSSGALVDRAA